jgi:uncharacterized DUF497 family protein
MVLAGVSYAPELTKTSGWPYIMDEDKFEWDDDKARTNLAKHRVSFEAACRVFDDGFAHEGFDSVSKADEIRYVITGMVNGIILTVVYTERGDRQQIISARKATKHEQREYYRSQTAE